MTNEEILKIAREAGYQEDERFLIELAFLFISKEREECAKIVDDECRLAFSRHDPDGLAYLGDAAKLIRARK
jgi:hypothetical protein